MRKDDLQSAVTSELMNMIVDGLEHGSFYALVNGTEVEIQNDGNGNLIVIHETDTESIAYKLQVQVQVVSETVVKF